jgi:hypothetical protein
MQGAESGETVHNDDYVLMTLTVFRESLDLIDHMGVHR